jgi:hypothetical protein
MSEKKQRPGGARKDEVITREYTINLHKRLHGWYGCQHLRASRLFHPPELPDAGCERILLVAVDFRMGTNRSVGRWAPGLVVVFNMCDLAFPCD